MHHSGLLRGSTGIPFILSGSLLARGPAHAPLALLPRTGQRALVKRAWLLAAALLLVAPRALFAEGGLRDTIFPIAATRASFERVKKVYEVFDAADHTGLEVFDGPHGFSGKLGLPFLAKNLGAA